MSNIGPKGVGFENRGKGHDPRNIDGLLKQEKARKQILLEPPERNAFCHHLDFSSVRPILDF